MAPFRIISLDGGGYRGLLTARLLQRLEEARPGFLSKMHLASGTSTGGILALALAAGLSPEELVSLYRDNGEAIFRKRWFGGIVGSKYSNDGLRAVLYRVFGMKKLKHLPKLVLVPSYDLDDDSTKPRQSRAKFWQNRSNDPESDVEELVVDVALRTSAAPTYFPSWRGHIDGGVVVNNPVACAVAEARSYGERDLRVLSLGTGILPSYIETKEDLNWGAIRWAPKIISMVIDGVNGVDDFQVQQDLEEMYHRVNPTLPENIDLDDVRATKKLIDLANQVDLTQTLAWIDQNW